MTAEQRIDRIRLAILQAQLAEFPASGIVLNPIDWALIELTKDGENRYIGYYKSLDEAHVVSELARIGVYTKKFINRMRNDGIVLGPPPEGVTSTQVGWVATATVEGSVRYLGTFDEKKKAEIVVELAKQGIIAPGLRKNIDDEIEKA